MLRWSDEVGLFQFVCSETGRRVHVVAANGEQAARLAEMKPSEMFSFCRTELIITEEMFVRRDCPDDASDL